MKVIIISFSIGFALLAAAISMSLVHASGATTDFLILHFDSYRNIDFTGTTTDLYLLLASGMGVLGINLALALFLRLREHFLSVIVSICSALLASLLFLSVSVILSNN